MNEDERSRFFCRRALPDSERRGHQHNWTTTITLTHYILEYSLDNLDYAEKLSCSGFHA